MFTSISPATADLARAERFADEPCIQHEDEGLGADNGDADRAKVGAAQGGQFAHNGGAEAKRITQTAAQFRAAAPIFMPIVATL